jgi:ATP-dependent protease ClpP protease subunit
VIVPKSNFRPNPARAIHVQGFIDQDLFQRLAPEILLLQNQSRDPITIYIDSPGGSAYFMLSLLKLLKAKGQDYEEPCDLITVVTRQAASAAADLLSAGNYALAFPDSRVLYHGGRLAEDRPITAERSSFLAQMLRLTNESHAMDLARAIEFRFIFRFIPSRHSFNDIRQKAQNQDMTDLDCFLVLISENLSEIAKEIIQTAGARYAKYGTLVESVLKKTKNLPPNKTPLEVEAAQIKAIIDFEVRSNKHNQGWSFQFGGMHRLTDDFLLFQEYQSIASSDRFKRWCSQYGKFLISENELNEISQSGNDEEKTQKLIEKASPVLLPIWSFFVALCHTLQQGENDFLTASDAYWMGLIDEVIGDEDLPPVRLLYEEQPDPSAKSRSKKRKILVKKGSSKKAKA